MNLRREITKSIKENFGIVICLLDQQWSQGTSKLHNTYQSTIFLGWDVTYFTVIKTNQATFTKTQAKVMIESTGFVLEKAKELGISHSGVDPKLTHLNPRRNH